MIFYLILALSLCAFVLFIRYKQAPGWPLEQHEIEHFMTLVDDLLPVGDADKRQRLRSFMEGDDGREFYMLNLLRFFDAVKHGEGVPEDFTRSPRAANAHYERGVLPLALKRGSLPIFAGSVAAANAMGPEPLGGRYDRVILMHYPSRRHFMQLVTDPGYKPFAPYKLSSMDVELVPVHPETVLPDIRFLAAAVAVAAFFAIGWLSAL